MYDSTTGLLEISFQQPDGSGSFSPDISYLIMGANGTDPAVLNADSFLVDNSTTTSHPMQGEGFWQQQQNNISMIPM
jgi:hypothetical protein